MSLSNYGSLLRNLGWWQRALMAGRLSWRLLWEKRVALRLKLIPVIAIIYFFSPYDLLPAFLVPGIGQLDDFLVVFIACRVFLSLVPAEIVREHYESMQD